ncbi:MAG: cupin domain-containing protein [Bradyrhizobium sp.]|nr:cupin domain-containing protein [Bradyrhizobium sp.]
MLTRSRAAYDAIFLLNAFLDAAHDAVSSHGGWIAGMTGGGIIAVFGRDGELAAACRAAVAASAVMDVALDRLNERFAAELGGPVKAAMGLACGPAYIGRIGAGPAKPLTAVGVAIDVASDLAAQAERRGTQLLADPTIFRHAGVEFIYMLSGKVRYRHADRLYLLEPGDALFFDAAARHGPEELIKAPMTYLSVIIYPRRAR